MVEDEPKPEETEDNSEPADEPRPIGPIQNSPEPIGPPAPLAPKTRNQAPKTTSSPTAGP
jgi:hypothetical protein